MSQLNINIWKQKLICIIVEYLNAIKGSEYAVILVKKSDRPFVKHVTLIDEGIQFVEPLKLIHREPRNNGRPSKRMHKAASV